MIRAGIMATKNIYDVPDFWNNNSAKTVNKIGSYTIIPYLNNIYYVSHGILVKNAIDTIAFLEVSDGYENIKTKHIKTIDEFELGFGKIESDLDFQLDAQNYMEFKIPEIGQQCIIINNIMTLGDDVEINDNNLECHVKNVKLVKLVRESCPSIPIIELEIHNFSDETNISSISGSPVEHNNKLIGIVHSHNRDQNTIFVIPIYCVTQLLYNSLKNLAYKISSFFADNEFNAQTIIIKKAYGRSDKQLKKNDIILKINNQNLSNNGLIKCNQMNIMLPYDTYIMLHNKNEEIELEINRKNKIKTMQIITTQLDSIAKIKKSDRTSFKSNGIIFVELTEDLIHFYKTMGYTIGGFANEIMNAKYNKQANDTFFVVVQIKWDELDENESQQYKSNGFPLVIKNDNVKLIPVLYKINNKRIKSIKDIIDESLYEPLTLNKFVYKIDLYTKATTYHKTKNIIL